jgi:hypothetical protein
VTSTRVPTMTTHANEVPESSALQRIVPSASANTPPQTPPATAGPSPSQSQPGLRRLGRHIQARLNQHRTKDPAWSLGKRPTADHGVTVICCAISTTLLRPISASCVDPGGI